MFPIQLGRPIHALSKYITLNRYENRHRYLHILPPESKPQSQECLDLDIENDIHWWSKLEPMLSTFRTACQSCLIPGTEVAIDEIMVRFYGRSSDTCKMPNKPIKQGYKIFALADNGYIWHFQLSSRQHRIVELHKIDDLHQLDLWFFKWHTFFLNFQILTMFYIWTIILPQFPYSQYFEKRILGQ